MRYFLFIFFQVFIFAEAMDRPDSQQAEKLSQPKSKNESITLLTSDNEIVSISKSLAERSNTWCNLMSDTELNEGIPVNLNSNLLKKLLSCIEKIDSSSLKIDIAAILENVAQEELIKLFNEINHLDIPELLEATRCYIVTLLTTKTDLQFVSHFTDLLNGEKVTVPSELKKLLAATFKKTDKSINLTCAKVLKGHTGPIYAAVISSDCKYVLTASEDKAIRLWDLSTGNTIKILQVPKDPLYSLNFCAENRRVVALSGFTNHVGHGFTIWSWDITKDDTMVNATESNFISHDDYILSTAAFSNDCTQLLTAHSDGSILLWQLPSGKPIKTRKIRGSVRKLMFSLNGQHALVICDNLDNPLNTAFQFYLVENESNSLLVNFESALPINSVSMSSNAKQLLIGGALVSHLTLKKDDYDLKKFDLAGIEVAFNPIECRYALITDAKGFGHLIDTLTETEINLLQGYAKPSQDLSVKFAKFTSTGNHALTGPFCDNTVIVWDLLAIENLALPQLILIARLNKCPNAVLNDYFKQVFDTLPIHIKQKFPQQQIKK